MLGLEIQLLGNFTFRYNDSPLQSVNSPRIQTLLLYLLLHRSTPQPRSYLAYLLWPDSNEIQARTNLRNLFHMVRNALPAADDFLLADNQTLQWWAHAPCGLDVENFESCILQAKAASQQKDTRACLAALERAIALYQGDLVPSCYSDWIMPERERLRQLYLKNLDGLIRLCESQQDYPTAIGHAHHLLSYDPLQETTYRKLMRLYAMSGDRAGVERVYQSCTNQLNQELKVQPSLATRQVYERLMHHPEKPSKTRLDMPDLPAEKTPLIGRATEWEQLEALSRSALAGKASFVMLSGSAGSGKTRLGQELLSWAASQEIKTTSSSCYATESDLPFAPVVAWLRALPFPTLSDAWMAELARVWPEIRESQPGAHNLRLAHENLLSYALFEALARAVLGDHQPLILFLDDLHWCDRFSLEWLHFVLHFDPQAPLLILASLRPEDAPDNPSLDVFLQTLRRQKYFSELMLSSLNEAQSGELVSCLLDKNIDPVLAARVFQTTEGNPLMIVEGLAAGLFSADSQNISNCETNQDCPPLPPKIQAVFAERLVRLSPDATQLVDLAAHLGNIFSFEQLQKNCNINEQHLIAILQELMKRHIFQEMPGENLSFSHHLLRDYVRGMQSTILRKSLQRRIAEASAKT